MSTRLVSVLRAEGSMLDKVGHNDSSANNNTKHITQQRRRRHRRRRSRVAIANNASRTDRRQAAQLPLSCLTLAAQRSPGGAKLPQLAYARSHNPFHKSVLMITLLLYLAWLLILRRTIVRGESDTVDPVDSRDSVYRIKRRRGLSNEGLSH